MKRLIIVASLAIAAIGCQKTEVQNEVLTPVGFNTEVGKQTRAIVQNGATYEDNFGVYAYLYDNAAVVTPALMTNQKVTAEGVTVDGQGTEVNYYWPNDPDNYINFYAYSPFSVGASMGTEGTFTLSAYQHTNYQGDNAVDFMVADAVKTEKYETHSGVVPVNFHHEMTQVKFAVTAETATGVQINIKKIEFDNAVQTADYTNRLASPFVPGTWELSEDASPVDVVVFSYGGDDTPANGFASEPVTMIPITPESVTVEYEVISNNVTESVEETFELDGTVEWAANKVITYKLSIGLKVISFDADVAEWDDDDEVSI